MTKTNWSPIKRDFIEEGTSYSELAKKHGVSEVAIRSQACRGKWKTGAQQLATQVQQKVVESLAERSKKHVEKMLKRYDDWLDTIDKTITVATKKAKAKESSMRDIIQTQIQIDQQARKVYGLDQRELEAQGAMIPLGGVELQQKMLEEIAMIRELFEGGKIKTIDIDPAEVAKMKIIRGI